MILASLICAIQLSGVIGDDLSARAFFDANNVSVGDPITLTLDFLGKADYTALRPPKLSRHVKEDDWKIDDLSAKTLTIEGARRLTYRVRPMREGVLYFPHLEFVCDRSDGSEKKFVSNLIPVHALAAKQVVAEKVESMVLPKPPELIEEAPLSADELFAWKKALNDPSADAFAQFDFPAAKMNEATMAIRAGDFERALELYSHLEWVIGQTEEIERGIIAALAVRENSPMVELPVWRQLMRPVLRHDWKGRLAIAAAFVFGFLFVILICSKLIRLLASLALILLPLVSAAGQSTLAISLAFDTNEKRIGEEFSSTLTLTFPKSCNVSNLQVTPSGDGAINLGEWKVSSKRENEDDTVTVELSTKARCDIPYEGDARLLVSGFVSGSVTRRDAHSYFSSSFHNGFNEEVRARLPKIIAHDGTPENFSGIVAEHLQLIEIPDAIEVAKDDVVKITCRLKADGYVPKDLRLDETSYLFRHLPDGSMEYHRYVVASEKKISGLELVFFNPKTQKFETAKTEAFDVEFR